MSRNHFAAGYVFSLGIILVLFAAAAPNAAQTAGNESSDHFDSVDLQRKAESALDRVQRDDVGTGVVDATYYVELAAHVEPRRAIPVLEAFFARSNDPEIRSETASVLVSLGDEDPQYWNLILHQAQAALGENLPDPFEIGKAGESQTMCSSESFLAWAKSHGMSVGDACKEAYLGVALRVRPLVDCGDRRAISVLQDALKSPNPLIQAMAAHGLVLTRDSDAVTLVIEAIEHAPPDQARRLADNLIESDDPRAQSVVSQYLPDVNFSKAHQFRTQNAQWRRPNLTSK